MLSLRDGIKINYRVVDNGCKDWIVVTHGIGEHMGRYPFMAELFSRQYNIFQYDLRGHGKSEGRRAYVCSAWEYVDDLEEIINFIFSLGARSYCLFGHSMGAFITSALIQRKVEPSPTKVFLSSPPIGLPGILGKIITHIPRFIFACLAKIPLSIPLKGMIDINYLSHDKKVVENYISDENNILGLHSRLLFSLIAISKYVFSKPLNCKVPLSCSVGEEDGIVNPQLLAKYFSQIEPNCNLKVISGGYHELHNEVKKYRTEYFEFLSKALAI